jgi:hypothetical protein
MQRQGKSVISGLFLLVVFLCRLDAQELSWDNSLRSLILKSFPHESRARLVFDSKLDYSVSLAGYYFINGQKTVNPSQFSLCHSLKYRFIFSSREHLHFTTELVHNLGVQCYLDSICRIGTDDNTLSSRLSLDVTGLLQFSFDAILKTRIFNEWNTVTMPNGGVARVLGESFLTPLVCIFSGGFGLKIPEFGSLNLGVASAKLTYLCDRSVFERTGLKVYYGVPEGKRSLTEYGLSMQLNIDRLIGKHIRWNCDLLLFKQNDVPVDFSLKNLFAYRISRYFKTSLQTQLFYDEKISRQLRIENLLSLGFDFHL